MTWSFLLVCGVRPYSTVRGGGKSKRKDTPGLVPGAVGGKKGWLSANLMAYGSRKGERN